MSMLTVSTPAIAALGRTMPATTGTLEKPARARWRHVAHAHLWIVLPQEYMTVLPASTASG